MKNLILLITCALVGCEPKRETVFDIGRRIDQHAKIMKGMGLTYCMAVNNQEFPRVYGIFGRPSAQGITAWGHANVMCDIFRREYNGDLNGRPDEDILTCVCSVD